MELIECVKTHGDGRVRILMDMTSKEKIVCLLN